MHNKFIKKKMTSGLWLVPVMGALLTGCASTKTPSAPPMNDEAAAFVSEGRAEMRREQGRLHQ